MMKDIEAFHEKFSLIRAGNTLPHLLTGELYNFRLKFIYEEFTEFVDANTAGDLAGAFDALIDMVYVILGTAHLMALPWEEGWDEVHRANMSKVRATNPSQSTRGTAYDVIKPDGFIPPDLKAVLEKHNARLLAQLHESSTKD